MERKEIKEFVDFQLESMDYTPDFSELDSLSKVELIMQCEKKFNITIEDLEIGNDWDTDLFIDYLDKKINK